MSLWPYGNRILSLPLTKVEAMLSVLLSVAFIAVYSNTCSGGRASYLVNVEREWREQQMVLTYFVIFTSRHILVAAADLHIIKEGTSLMGRTV